MKAFPFFIICILIVIVSSCGPSTQEKAAQEKAKLDSVIKATEDATKQKLEVKRLIQDSLRQASHFKEAMSERLLSKKGDLEIAKDRMNKIKEFHFGRTSSEREQQIKNQVIIIDSCEKDIEKINSNIFKIQKKIDDLNAELQKFK